MTRALVPLASLSAASLFSLSTIASPPLLEAPPEVEVEVSGCSFFESRFLMNSRRSVTSEGLREIAVGGLRIAIRESKFKRERKQQETFVCLFHPSTRLTLLPDTKLSREWSVLQQGTRVDRDTPGQLL